MPVNIRFFVRLQGRKCTDGRTVVVYIRIKQSGKVGEIMISTGIRCAKNDFNPNKQVLKDQVLNQVVQRQKQEIQRKILVSLEDGKIFNLGDVRQLIQAKTNISHGSLKDLVFMMIEQKADKIKRHTIDCQIKSINRLLAITEIGNKELHTITTSDFIQLLEAAKEYYHFGTMKQNCMVLNWALNRLEKLEYIPKNPLKRIDLKEYTNSAAKVVIRPDYEALESQLQIDSNPKAKAAFFQLHTGMAFIDLKELQAENFQRIQNVLCIVKERHKNKNQFLVPITEELFCLFEQLNGFSWLEYANYNNYLKKHYRITTHSLRHLRARHLLDLGLSLEAVARVLGHKSINMTMRYAPIQGRRLSPEEMNTMLQS